MLMNKLFLSAVMVAGAIGVMAGPMPARAASDVGIQLNFGPPPPRYEAVPPPRHGYLWSPGYWAWDGYRRSHYWVPGHWERARPGYAYHAPRWAERGGRWYYQAPVWERENVADRRDRVPYGVSPRDDIDRDGIPNDRDPTPGRQRPDRD